MPHLLASDGGAYSYLPTSYVGLHTVALPKQNALVHAKQWRLESAGSTPGFGSTGSTPGFGSTGPRAR